MNTKVLLSIFGLTAVVSIMIEPTNAMDQPVYITEVQLEQLSIEASSEMEKTALLKLEYSEKLAEKIDAAELNQAKLMYKAQAAKALEASAKFAELVAQSIEELSKHLEQQITMSKPGPERSVHLIKLTWPSKVDMQIKQSYSLVAEEVESVELQNEAIMVTNQAIEEETRNKEIADMRYRFAHTPLIGICTKIPEVEERARRDSKMTEYISHIATSKLIVAQLIKKILIIRIIAETLLKP